MALAFGSTVLEWNHKTSSSGSSNTLPSGNAITADDLLILIAATDNIGTGDTNTTNHTSFAVSQTGKVTTTFTKIREFTNGQGAAAAGATVSIWYAVAADTYSGATGTVSFVNTTGITAKAFGLYCFTKDVGSTINVATQFDQDVVDNGFGPAVPMAMTSMTSREYLAIEAFASEQNAQTITPDAGWTALGPTGTSGGSATTNMFVGGQWDIATATSFTSTPALGTAADMAFVLVALYETGGTPTPVTIPAQAASVVGSTSLAITVPAPIPANAASGAASTSAAVRVPAPIPANATSAVATTSATVKVVTKITPSSSSAFMSTSLNLYTPIQVNLDPNDATATTSTGAVVKVVTKLTLQTMNAIGSTRPVLLAMFLNPANGIASGSAALFTPAPLTISASSAVSSATALVARPERVPLATANAVASTRAVLFSMFLNAANAIASGQNVTPIVRTFVQPNASSSQLTNGLGLSVPGEAPITAQPANASASTSATVKVVTRVQLAAANSIVSGSAALKVVTRIPLGASNTIGSGSATVKVVTRLTPAPVSTNATTTMAVTVRTSITLTPAGGGASAAAQLTTAQVLVMASSSTTLTTGNITLRFVQGGELTLASADGTLTTSATIRVRSVSIRLSTDDSAITNLEIGDTATGLTIDDKAITKLEIDAKKEIWT